MSEIENLKIYGGATYTVGNQDIIANEWEAGKTYVKNKSYVIREHRLYVCNTTHTSVEPFDATKWTEITIGDAIAANTTAIGDLSQLTTTDKSSLVGAVNSFLPRVVYSKKDWANSHEFATPNDTAFMLYTDSDTSVAKVRIFNNNSASLYNISGSSITGVTYANGTLTVAVNNRGLVAVRII